MPTIRRSFYFSRWVAGRLCKMKLKLTPPSLAGIGLSLAKIRKPKFQTIPAFEKRVKQEVRWKAATRTVRMKSNLPPLFPSKIPRKSLYIVTMPGRTNDFLDQQESTSAPPLVSSTTMIVKTRKHLSAANHFPANSRMFNRSLQQLQNQSYFLNISQ